MYKEITTEQLSATVEDLLTNRLDGGDPSQPNLIFYPKLEGCSGPEHTVSFRFHTYRWMKNPNQVVHGGMIAALLDNAMGMTCICLYGDMTPTISLSINYCRPVPLDADIIIRIRAVTTGSTNCQLTAEIFLPDAPQLPLVTALGVYYTARVNR